MKKNKQLQFNTLYRPEPEGGFTAMVPSLPGCVSYGATLEEAQLMIKDAIDAYIISLKKHRESIPHDGEVLIGTTKIVHRYA